MVTLVNGLMGGGKTFYAVHYILNNKDKYSSIYTNINGFKFSEVEKVKPFSLSTFKSLISECKGIYDLEDTSDKDIHNFLVSKGFLDESLKDDKGNFLPVLYVIDEAHNIFDSKSDLLTWFVTYHRHLYLDIILVTQDYKLIHYSFHKLFQNILHVVPDSNKLNNRILKYQKHIKLPISDSASTGTKVGIVTLKKDKDIFKLYESGDVVRSSNILYKYIAYIFLGFGASFLLYLFLINMLLSHKDTSNNLDNNSTTKVSKSQTVNSNKNQLRPNVNTFSYLTFKCIDFYCVSKDKRITFYVNDLPYLLSITGSKLLGSKKYSNHFSSITLFASSSFVTLFIKKEDKRHDKKNIVHKLLSK